MNENNKNEGNSKLFLGLAIGIVIGIVICFIGVCVFASVFGLAGGKKEATAVTEQDYANAVEAQTEEKKAEQASENVTQEITTNEKDNNKDNNIEESSEKSNSELPKSPVKIYEWEENRIYDTDHQATYKGKLYRAKWNNIGNKPDESGEYGVWELLDDNYER